MNRIKCLSKTHWLRWCSKSWKMLLVMWGRQFKISAVYEKEKQASSVKCSHLIFLYVFSSWFHIELLIKKTFSIPSHIERDKLHFQDESKSALSIPNKTSTIIPFLFFIFFLLIRMTYKIKSKEKIFGIKLINFSTWADFMCMCKFLKLLNFCASRFTSFIFIEKKEGGRNNYGNKLHTKTFVSSNRSHLNYSSRVERILFGEICWMEVWERAWEEFNLKNKHEAASSFADLSCKVMILRKALEVAFEILMLKDLKTFLRKLKIIFWGLKFF